MRQYCNPEIRERERKKMKEITLNDCYKLKEEFDKYTLFAEQHEFPLLFITDLRLTSTIDRLEKQGLRMHDVLPNQSEARAMFRVVKRIIGEDFSEYEENSNG